MIVVAVILYATLNSDPMGADQLPAIPHIDKLIHAVMFGGLFSAIAFDRYRAGLSIGTKPLLVIAIICAGAGALDEFGQEAMHNGRSADIVELVADCTGIAVAYFTAPPAIRKVVKKR